MLKRIRLNLLLTLLLIMSPLSVNSAEDAYCATVKIEIQQELSLERQAFDAVMKINNGLDTLPIEDVNISVSFLDENNLPVVATNDPNDTNPLAKFFIRIDSMTGINNVSGTGVVAPGTSAEIRWLIIPIPGAADGLPGGKLYFVGANLSYRLGGQLEVVDVAPDFITVKPLPQLALDYFLTEEVIGDDAFTSAIEAPEPYTLGVRIKNNGTGVASNVRIDSAQPKIVENEQGLLVDFIITGSTLNNLPSAPTLLIDFGTINSGEASTGRWIMETSLSGKFTEFTAKVAHADELGGAVTSIIDSNDINTHFLLHDVRVDLPGRDYVRDFLGKPAGSSAGVLKIYESDSVDTDVNIASVGATFPLISQSATEAHHALTMPIFSGFSYAKIPDPYSGGKVVTSAFRSDGKTLLLDNVWTSKTRNRNTSPPSWEYWINIFDVNSTGNYVVNMDDLVIGPLSPVIQVITNKVTYEGNQVGFLIESSDPNGDSVALSAMPLPSGATFVDNADGTAFFNWTPSVGQAGTYLITYKSTDGVLTSSRTATIKVNLAGDTDGDGLDDAWEIENFGNLDRDGTGDFDGDGISDLDEYLNGSNAVVVPPAVPTNFVASSGNTQVALSWSDVIDATSYRLYWSTTPTFTKETSELIDNVTSLFIHSNLTNDVPYYYALSSVGAGGESELSAEITVVPGNKNWGVPSLVENSDNSILDYQVAYSENGTAIAIWTENDTVRTNVWASAFSENKGWDVPQLIEFSDTTNASALRIEINDYGNAIALWKQSDGLNDSVWSTTFNSSVWGNALEITTASVDQISHAELVLTNSGAAIASWLQAETDQTIMTNVWSSLLFANGAAWNTAVRIDAATGAELSGLQLANDSLGNVMAVWAQTNDAGVSYNFAVNTFSNNQWEVEQIIRSGMTGELANTVVKSLLVMNKQGDAILSWSELNIVNSIMSMHYTIANGWEAAALVEFDGVNAAYEPSIAISDNGDAFVVWTQSNGTRKSIYSNRFSQATGWESSSTLISSSAIGDPVGDAGKPMVKLDAAGNATVVWQQLDSQQSNIWANRLDAINNWDSPIIIETLNGSNAEQAILKVDGNGRAIVVWRQTDGAFANVLSNQLLASNTGVPNIEPIVVIPESITVDASTSVVIDGSESFDQDGFVALYEWIQVSGTAVINLSGNFTNTLSFTSPSPTIDETIVFQLKITDGDNLVSIKNINIIVNANLNILPTVNAGSDQSVNEGSLVSLMATANDVDGTIVSYQWSQTSGSAVTLIDSYTPNASFTAPTLKITETFVFNVLVTDDAGATANAQVQISVNPVNTVPVVSAGVDQTIAEQSLVNLSGGATDPDADGTIISYAWSQISGAPVTISNATASNASFVAPTLILQDVLVLRLTVTDDEGGISSADVNITVTPVNALPVVNAGIDKLANEQAVVSLNGSANDSDGTIVSYSWAQTSGMAVSLSSVNTATASFTAPTVLETDGVQTLSFTLTVTDNEGGVSSDAISISINPVNSLPTSIAGVDQSVDEQSAVTLIGSASDTDGSIATYVWSQTAGVPVTITGANTATVNFTAPVVLVQDGAQVLSFTLTATDNEGGSATDSINVTINAVNSAPVANAGIDQSVDEQTGVALTGAANDADGSIISYLWTQTAGIPVTLTGTNTATANFTAPVVLVQDGAQVLSFSLSVTDNEGSVSTDTINVTVNPVNAIPIANAGIDQSVDEQSAVTLNGVANDTDGSITTHVWSQTAGVPVTITGANTATVNFTAPVVLVQDGAQVLSFTLTATDNEGGIATDSINVTINAVNSAPVANAGIDKFVFEQTSLNINGNATDADGSIVSNVWTQTAGIPVVLTGTDTLSLSFATPIVLVQDGSQILSFELLVTDNEGAVSTDVIDVTVNPVNSIPTSNAGIDQSVDEQSAVILNGVANDTDGSIATYVWSQTAGVPVTITGTNTATVNFTAPVVLVQDGAQVLSFTLTATDNEGGIATDSINVTINAVNSAPVANAGIDQSVDEQIGVALTGAANDADGSIISYLWTQTAGIPVTLTGTNTASINFTSPIVLVQDGAQVLSFNLTVTDNEGAVSTDTINVTVSAVNALPTSNAGLDQSVNEQTAVRLAGGATDTDGGIATYAWSQIAGTPVTLTGMNLETANFTSPIVLVPDGAQILSFSLTVTDNEGAVSTDTINVTVNPVNTDPVISAGINQVVAEGSIVGLQATSSDSDGVIAGYSWTQLSGPIVVLAGSDISNATFSAPLVYQDTTLSFQVRVTDNEGGQSLDTISVVVYSTNPDDDSDGMDDLWEVNQFGDMSRDGNGDLDKDGFTDYQEYHQGTNPLAFTLPAPLNLKAVADDSQVTLSWMPVTGAIGYNLYWSVSPNITPSSESLIPNVGSNYVHTGLTNGNTYYYVVTALSNGDESVVSVETSATPGIRAWNTAQSIDSVLIKDSVQDIAVNAGGQSVAIWAQFNGAAYSAWVNHRNPDTGWDTSDQDLAVNAGGQSVAIWSQFDGVAYSAWVNHRNPDTGWGTAEVIETGDNGNVYYPQAAISDNGTAIAVWEQYDGVSYNVWSNNYSPQSGWGTAQRIETNGLDGAVYFHPQVAMDKRGNAIATWQQISAGVVSIWVNHYDVSLGWQTAQLVETDDLYNAFDPKVAINETGNAIVVWEQSDGTRYNIISNRYDVTTGQWSTASVIDNDDGHAYDAQISMDRYGNGVAVWEQFDGVRYNVWSNVYDAITGWGTASYIEYNAAGGSLYFYPQVAMDDHGNATAVWQQLDGATMGIWANRLVNGVWGTATAIEPIDYAHSLNPEVSMDSDGNVVVAWEQADDGGANPNFSIWSNRYSIYDGAWLQAQPLEFTDAAIMQKPQVGIDDYGNAVTIWWSSDAMASAVDSINTSVPIANAGLDQSGYARDVITLNGSTSIDQPGGQILTYNWHQLSGIETALDGKTTATPSLLIPRVKTPTKLEFLLTVTNVNGVSMTDKIVVTALP